MRILKLSPDIAGGVHVGKDDLGVGAGGQGILLGYVSEETGNTDVRSLMIGLDAVNEAAIMRGLKLAAVGTAFRTNGFGVETVHCEDLSFTVWGVGGQVEVHPLWRHFYQGPHGLIHVVNSTDLNKVVDAQEELNNLVKNETPDAVVLVLANTLTHSIASCPGQKSGVNMNVAGHRHSDVSRGRNAVSIWRRCGGSLGFRSSWGGAAVPVCQTVSCPPRSI